MGEKSCPSGVKISCFVSEGVKKIPVFGQGVEKIPILSEGVTAIFLPLLFFNGKALGISTCKILCH